MNFHFPADSGLKSASLPRTVCAMRRLLFLGTLCALAHLTPGHASGLPDNCSQLIVGLAETWDAGVGHIQCFSRTAHGWQAVTKPQRVLFGTNGLAWGIGLAGQDEHGLHKKEGDKRAPAGIFGLGKIYTYDSSLPPGADYPFHTVTPADAWISDPQLPHYNEHVVVDLTNPPPWFKKQQMKQTDPPHRWKIEIRHNEEPPVPGAGSAIFFHIQRGPNKHSSGCTTMPQDALLGIIRWLRAADHPCYVLLPVAEYRAKWKAWNLPSPAMVGLTGK